MSLNPADEPAVYTGGVLGVFAAGVTVASAFGWIHWSAEQQVAVASLAVIVLPVLQGLITRQFVRPRARSVPAPSGRGKPTAPPRPH